MPQLCEDLIANNRYIATFQSLDALQTPCAGAAAVPQ
jgi:hypothetical protein